MKKLTVIFFIMILMALLISGCGPQSKQTHSDSQILYTVEDSTGEKLSFYEKPQRIISLNVSVDEILLDLVPAWRIAALSRLADDPSICSAGDKVKGVQGRLGSNDVESILSLQPDVVLLPDYNIEAVRTLRSAGVKVYVCHTPSNMQDIVAFIKEIGTAVGEQQAGENLASDLEQKLKVIRQKTTTYKQNSLPPKVLCLSFTGPVGSKGTFSDICYYAGTINALDGIDIPYQSNLSEEKMLELNPDIIITPSWDYSKQGDPEKFRQKILHNPVYKDLNAIKNKKVVRLHDNYLYSTSHYAVRAVEELAVAAYPKIFAE